MQRGVIVGCGAMGKCHGEAYSKIENAKIIAVVDTDRAKGEALAEQLHCKWVASMGDLQAEQVDFVDICLPTFLHLPAIREAAELTDKIICEKPLAVKKEEIEEALSLIREKNLKLMVAHVLRFFEGSVKTKELIEDGTLGAVNSISCTRRQKMPAWSGNNWFANTALSGGLVFDLLIHDLDYVVWMLGKPKAVVGHVTYSEEKSPAHVKVQLHYENCTADMVASWGMPRGFAEGGLRSSLEVIGENAMVYSDNTGSFVLTDHEGAKEYPMEGYDGYEAELRYFVECCEQGIVPEKVRVDSVEVSLEVAHAVITSIEEQKIIRLEK